MRTSDLSYDQEHEDWLLREEGYDMAIADMIRMVSGYMRETFGYSDKRLVDMFIYMFFNSDSEEEAWIPALKNYFKNEDVQKKIDELCEKE